jgi:hypothetical protein
MTLKTPPASALIGGTVHFQEYFPACFQTEVNDGENRSIQAEIIMRSFPNFANEQSVLWKQQKTLTLLLYIIDLKTMKITSAHTERTGLIIIDLKNIQLV